jgi:penicillin-binding protein 1A
VRVRTLVAVSVLLAGGCAYTPTDIAPEIPANAQSSKIFADDGSLLYAPHGPQNRVEVPLARIPAIMQNAVIAIEDERFYEHHGVDVRAIVRAAKTNADQGDVAQGGSTITQQLVKNTLLNSGKTFDRKVQEAALAWQLEDHYSKQRILEIYLNTVYFGNGAYGVEAAAEEYFGVPVDQLGTTQAALIAGLIQAPSADDPVLHPDAALARRNTVLDRLRDLAYITPAEHDADVATALLLAPTPEQDRYPAPYFIDEVKKFIEGDDRFGATVDERDNTFFSGGLRIYTTLDPTMQHAAEDAVSQVVPDPSQPEAALVAVDPQTGFVKAMVGGRDYFGTEPTAKCNLAIGCKKNPGRGTGSAFKPFVLAAALTQGIPLSETLAAPGCIDLDPPTGPWHVCNADPGEGAPGGTDLIEGTVHSFNTLYAQLVLQVGPQNAVDMAKKLGITTTLQAVPSAVLGANDVTVLDMASAYGTFANHGVHVPPAFVTRITTADGTIVYEGQHAATKSVDAGVADTVSSVLTQVIARGTGTAAQLDRPAAGKTGTGEDYKNAWFCGYTPRLAAAVWVGFPESEVSMHPPTTSITVFGGTWPAQIWQKFMTEALAGTPADEFTAPPVPPTTTTVPGAPTTAPDGPPIVVPDVRGQAYADAAAELTARGFTVGRFDIASADVAPGAVSGQSPVGGTAAPPGSTVTLEVASSQGGAAVPDVVGREAGDARGILRDAGFAVQVVEQPNPEGDTSPGIVWRTSPRAGTTAPRGSTVTIFVNPR